MDEVILITDTDTCFLMPVFYNLYVGKTVNFRRFENINDAQEYLSINSGLQVLLNEGNRIRDIGSRPLLGNLEELTYGEDAYPERRAVTLSMLKNLKEKEINHRYLVFGDFLPNLGLGVSEELSIRKINDFEKYGVNACIDIFFTDQIKGDIPEYLKKVGFIN